MEKRARRATRGARVCGGSWSGGLLGFAALPLLRSPAHELVELRQGTDRIEVTLAQGLLDVPGIHRDGGPELGEGSFGDTRQRQIAGKVVVADGALRIGLDQLLHVPG